MKPLPTGIAACLVISTMIFAASCTKSTTPRPPGNGSGSSTPPANNNYLASITNGQFSNQLDSFTYDNSNRLTKIISTIGSGTIKIGVGSINIDTTGPLGTTVTFFYSGSNTFPSSYTTVSFDLKSHLHQLYYDGQGRIIKDTALDNSGFVDTWSYPNGNIAAVLNSGTGGVIIDTLFFSNGNVTAQHLHEINTGEIADTVYTAITYTYSTIVNPNYHQAIASTYGPLLSYVAINGEFGDFISANVISTVSDNSQVIGLGKLPGGTDTETYTWTTDSKGRAATLKVTDKVAGAIANEKFSYY
jgi:YD repeat-containing protein